MKCTACDKPLYSELLRDRDDFCLECNHIIDMLVHDIFEIMIEEPFGLYEDWEAAEKDEEED